MILPLKASTNSGESSLMNPASTTSPASGVTPFSLSVARSLMSYRAGWSPLRGRAKTAWSAVLLAPSRGPSRLALSLITTATFAPLICLPLDGPDYGEHVAPPARDEDSEFASRGGGQRRSQAFVSFLGVRLPAWSSPR